jgi:hypothetical protein
MGVASRRDDLRPRLAAVAGLAGVGAYLAAVDPAEGGVWPPCPSRTLLGLDCPGCGGLRGTHDLLRGDLLGALDHNLLLPVAVGVIAVALALWLLPLVGRPARVLRFPPWATAAAIAVVATFTVLRNLPFPALDYLAST